MAGNAREDVERRRKLRAVCPPNVYDPQGGYTTAFKWTDP